MKERPIIFSAEMVKAILDGRKTQTRRVVKNLPIDERYVFDVKAVWLSGRGIWTVNGWRFKCPYGTIGDRPWVRETWTPIYSAPQWLSVIRYKADMPENKPLEGWMSPLYMPRKYSRITLEITDVRVERVQNITENDARAEGSESRHLDDLGQAWSTYKRGFQALWDSLNAKRGYPWESNPWVWVIEFKRIKG